MIVLIIIWYLMLLELVFAVVKTTMEYLNIWNPLVKGLQNIGLPVVKLLNKILVYVNTRLEKKIIKR